MGRHKKGRSVRNNKNIGGEPEDLVQAPHSFVIHKGLPGGHLLELTKDFRKVMEPFTASALKERKRNTIKDFVSVAGLLHVTHMTIFSKTQLGTYMKLCKLPRGPTLTFKLHNFSLARDVVSSLKKQLVVDEAFKHSSLVVLNGFTGEGMQMKLMTNMFQSMFPSINVMNVDLNTVRRCVLINYNQTSKLIDFRHYNIKVIPVGVSKGVKKIIQGKVPNLANCNEISEFLTKSGILSESEAEDDPNHHVDLPQKIISRGNIESGKSSIKLSELGPRITFQLIKVEDGLMDGEVLFHDFIEKSDKEKLEIMKKRESRLKLKEKRKKIQEENKKAKEQTKQEHKEKSLKGMQKQQGETTQKQTENAEEPVQQEEDDDAQYYRDEVGEEPDQDLFKTGTKRPFRTQHPDHINKKRKPNSDDHVQKRKFEGADGHNRMKMKNKGGKPYNQDGDRRNKMRSKGDKNNSQSGDRRNKMKKKGDRTNSQSGDRRNKVKKKGDKTNSQSRDHRPIGGKFGTKPKFATKGKFNKKQKRK